MIQKLIRREQFRQSTTINMIASENTVSENVMRAMGSCLTNKYSEGYAGARYYAGNEITDLVEEYAVDLAKKIFMADHANVQPHSGSQANQAVYMAMLKPGATILSMSLDAGGHLTHGAKVSQSGQIYKIVHYGLDANGVIDYAQIEILAKQHKPKIIIAGGSAYSLIIDFERIAKICRENSCLFMVDMAHFAGLVATGFYPNPMKFADIVTSTTHKTLRGPRGGLILCKAEHAKAIDKAVFPGVQGGPLMHIIAAKAVCFEEAMQESFKTYMQKVINNTAYLAKGLQSAGMKLVGGGTESHLILIDLSDTQKSGAQVQDELEKRFGIVVNKNKIWGDKRSAQETSGIRLGLPFITNNKRVDKNVLDEIRDIFAHVILGTPEPKIRYIKKAFRPKYFCS